MSDQWELSKNLGRQGPAARTPGMWPDGEPANLRALYDSILRVGHTAPRDAITTAGTTKICYNCRGTGKSGGKQCTACSGTGSVPAAG